MLKRLIIGIFICLTGYSVAYGLLNRKQLAKADQLTVIVENVGFLGKGRGTGILLDATHVLTCAHLIGADKDEFFVYTYPLGRVYKAVPEMADQKDDIAILVLESSAPVTAKVKFAPAEVGDEITVIGNALGSSEWVVTHGIVSATERGYLLTDALINPGNSGGPWLNNKGEIVGMTDWTIGPNEKHHERGICGGIDARVIMGVLDSYKMMQALQAALSK